jgi:YebC/PmpR family DNA-binding regulatory protein
MSGHSKWASIKHKKGAADAKRGQIFTKIIKEITVAAKMGGGDEEGNARLRTAILKAKAANMPKDNIDKAIKKGTGELEGVEYVELQYEGYGPGGIALLIETLTDNKNRTAADVKSVLGKGGGNLGTPGSVSHLFKREGIICFDASKYTEDAVLEAALEAGAEDVATEDDEIVVKTSPEDFMNVLDALNKAGFEQTSAEIERNAMMLKTLDKEKTEKVLKLVERLEELDDVQEVSHDLDVPDDFELDD